VYIEPCGTEFILLRGDVFYLESEAFATGDLEVSHVAEGIVLGFTSGAPIVLTTVTGGGWPSEPALLTGVSSADSQRHAHWAAIRSGRSSVTARRRLCGWATLQLWVLAAMS
jgi:hypothetical protein